MNRRTLVSAFHCSNRAVRIAGRRFSIPQRSFSNSSIRLRYGAVPKFTEVSSTELQELLSSLRDRVFLPAHLSKEQQDLIFMAKHKQKLEVEDVKATIAGEEFILKPLDSKKDILGKSASLRKAVFLMTETRDWNNLPNLLQGLTTAGLDVKRKLKRNVSGSDDYVVYKAGSEGQQAILLECLRRGNETGLTLTRQDFVIQVYFWMQQKAMTSDWDVEHTKKALLWAETVKDLMQDPKHRVPQGSKPVNNMHEVNGILLELAAVRAVKHQDGKDVDGKVGKYARELLASPRDFEARRSSDTEDVVHGDFELNAWVSTNSMVVHGTKLAQTVLGPSSELSIGLKEIEEALEPLVSTAREELSQRLTKKGDPKAGVQIYDKLLDSGAL